MTSPSQSFLPGAVIADRYRIEEQIGEGGFGAVFRATQLNLGRAVALKILLPELLENDGLHRFQREAELAQRLAHPNTVRLLDFGRAADTSPFLVFELLKGQTLEAVIVRTRGLSAARVARVATQILKALMEAHGLGIVHRDIKPANVFLCDFDGEPDFVKILDFGIASGADLRSLTKRGEVVGTPRYMAPEQVMGLEATFASDLYALGLLMSEALSGRPVFEGLSGVEVAREQVSENPVPHAREALQSPLGAVILRATQKAPERRYGSAAEMLAHLEAALPPPRPSHAGPGASAVAFGQAPTGVLGAQGGGYGGHSGGLSGPMGAGPYTGASFPAGPPARRGPKQGAPPWVLLGALGGAAALLATALVVVLMVTGRGRSRDDLDGGAAALASGDAGAGAVAFAQGGGDGPVEASINGDGVPDFVAFTATSKEPPSREPPAHRVCAFDGATFRALWCTPVQLDSAALRATYLGVAGSSLVYADPGGVAHVLDLATGAERGTVKVSSRVAHVCSAAELPGKLWLKTEDRQGLVLDPAARGVAPGPRPASCRKSRDEHGCYPGSNVPTCPVEAPYPRPATLHVDDVTRDGADAVGIGRKAPATTLPMLLGFTSGKERDGRDAVIRWQRPVAPGDGLGGVMGSHPMSVRLAGGRAIAAYDDLAGVNHLVAVEAASGRTLWDATTESYFDFSATPTRVFVSGFSRLDVRDAATGKLLGGVGRRP